VTVDGARWRWAHTSGGPLILAGFPPGPHHILIELVNANHKPIANSTVKFEVPQLSKRASGYQGQRRLIGRQAIVVEPRRLS